MSNDLKAVNLAISTHCDASCKYCPHRGEPSHMSLQTAKVIARQAADLKTVVEMQLSENGNALLNPDFVPILRVLRDKLPGVRRCLTTNLYAMTPELSDLVIGEGLIDCIHFNLDGHDKATYAQQKGLDLDVVLANARHIREQWPHYPLSASALTLPAYLQAIRGRFGRDPLLWCGVEALPSCFGCIQEMVRELGINVRRSPIFAWAERDHTQHIPDHMVCPQLPRVETEAFISPTGNWYACCLDATMAQTFGNVHDTTLSEMAASDKRQSFIRRLRDRDFAGIDYPCNTVPYCQVIV